MSAAPAVETVSRFGADGTIPAGYWTETKGVWDTNLTAFPSIANGTFEFFNGGSLSCSAPGYCTVIGQISTESLATNGPGIETETKGKWGTPVLEPSADPEGETPSDVVGLFNSVSCPDAKDCAAVGFQENVNGAPIYALVATETNGAWAEAIPEPFAIIDDMNSVSCASAGNCTAVGYAGTEQPSPGSTAAYQIETDGTWGSETEFSGSVPSGETYSTASSQMTGVSCPHVGDCITVGGDWNGDPTYAVESNGVFGPAIAAATQTDDSDGFRSVSCTSTADCTAVGTQDGLTYSDSISNTPSVTVTDNFGLL